MKRVIRIIGMGLGVAAMVGALAQERHFSARLSVVPIDTRTQAGTTGEGRAEADLDGNRLTIRGTFGGLAGPATAARLHEGIVTGVRGPAIYELTVTNAAQGDVRGSLELTASQVDALLAGRLYLQIHSESAPDGNLWGWLLE